MRHEMNTEQRVKMISFINKMQFFNCADNYQFHAEREKRNDLQVAARIDIIKWLVDGLFYGSKR